jgi:glycosyltransferase involved in cell wall biosynthesis
MTGEDDLGVRKWHIDPFVDAINRSRSRYVADVFFRGDDLRRFAIAVIVKHGDAFPGPVLRAARESGTRLVYDTADIRFIETPDGLRDIYADPGARGHHHEPFVRAMDALILASPLQRPEYAHRDVPQVEIARPLLNRRHRTAYGHGGPIRILWQGYAENLAPMERIHPIVGALRKETGLDVVLVYDTNLPARDDGAIRYTRWRIRRWEQAIAACDIGVAIKPLDDPFQQRKASSKVVSYMGAGLPVVCTPSPMDRRAITHGRTGFFAYDDRDWHGYLQALVMDASLRERIGTAARRHVAEAYHPDRLVGEYLELFDRVLARGTACRA